MCFNDRTKRFVKKHNEILKDKEEETLSLNHSSLNNLNPFLKSFVSKNSHNDQTNASLIELVRDFKEDNKNKKLIIEKQKKFMKEMMMEMEKLKRDQGKQNPHQNSSNEKMKGKLDESGQYEHSTS